ncbi:hypothetical protein WSS15_00010 [Acetobacter pasteurianus]|nr:hypothetical protein NBRC3279_2492 [Acetobacter pasteurianus NBRC 3279]GCD73333.1 hypothetical protein NBRC3284_2489 [Acetobacter pasteurianus NBRC 3284]GLH27351.1 hypothetical protein WSS15_00010 [Acetobacter pasteurianus]
MLTLGQAVVALVEGAALATVVQAAVSAVLEEVLVTVALAGPVVVALLMVAQAVVSVVLEEASLMGDLAAHVEAPVAGGRVRGAAVGMAAGAEAHGDGVTHIMGGVMVDRGATRTGVAAGAGEHHLCSVQCLVWR